MYFAVTHHMGGPVPHLSVDECPLLKCSLLSKTNFTDDGLISYFKHFELTLYTAHCYSINANGII